MTRIGEPATKDGSYFRFQFLFPLFRTLLPLAVVRTLQHVLQQKVEKHPGGHW